MCETRDGELRVIHAIWLHGERECRWTPAAPRTGKAEPVVTPAIPKAPKLPSRASSDHPWRRMGQFGYMAPA